MLVSALKFLLLFLLINHATSQMIRKKSLVHPIDGANYDFDFVYNFTKYLHEKHRFNTFISFCKDRVRSRPKGVVVRSLERALLEDFQQPLIVWGMERTSRLRDIIGLNNLVFVQISEIDDPILDVVDHMLDGLHFTSMLFFYKAPSGRPPNAGEIEEFFQWCWERNIINVALTFQIIKLFGGHNETRRLYVQNQVYNYTPFPKMSVFNLTNRIYTDQGGFIVDKISNVKGYEFKTPIFKNPPSVFLTRFEQDCHHLKKCDSAITGTAGRLYREFIKKINGTINIVRYANASFEDLQQRILIAAANKEIQIGIHPFSPSSQYAAGIDGSYPIAQTNVCLIVPFVAEIPLSEYLSRSFQTTIWLLMLLTFFLLLLLHYFIEQLNFLKSHSKQQHVGGTVFLYTAHTMLNHPFVFGMLRKRSFYFKLFHLIMFFMIFVIYNMYACSLTSLFNIEPVGQQIDTAEDFLKTDLKIMVSSFEKKVSFDTARLPTELLPRTRVFKRPVVERHKNSLNTSFAYLATSETWQLMQLLQQRLRKPRFRMPSKKLCSAKFFLKFPLQWDSPFTLSLALFFMKTQEGGLDLKWRQMSIHQANQMKLFDYIKEKEDPWKPLSLAHFHNLAILSCMMWVSALICFVLEIFSLRIMMKKLLRFCKVHKLLRLLRNKFK